MNENFEEYILDRKDKAGNFKKLINFYTNIWAGAKDGKNKKLIIKSCDCNCYCSSDSQSENLELIDLKLKNYIENDKELYKLFKEDKEEKYNKLNEFYSAGIKKKGHLQNIIEIIKGLEKEIIEGLKKEVCPKNLFDALDKHNNKEDTEKLSLYQSFISKYCHWHHEVNKSQNHFPIFDKNVKYSLVYYQMTGAEIKSYEHLKHLVDKFIEEYLPKEYKDLDDEYKIESRNESHPENPEKLVGVNRIKLKLEIKIEENDVPNSLHEEISIYRLVDKFLWLQYEIHSKILKKI
jgi:hypothetical protein